MELFHTSPNEISAISKTGRFGEFLFFSANTYQMSAGDVVTYKIDVDENSIIDASSIFYHECAAKLDALVSELAKKINVDAETAESLIDESTNIYDISDDVGIDCDDVAEISWDIQRFTARAAQILGFRGVRVSDEQGQSYLIDMNGAENQLQRV